MLFDTGVSGTGSSGRVRERRVIRALELGRHNGIDIGKDVICHFDRQYCGAILFGCEKKVKESAAALMLCRKMKTQKSSCFWQGNIVYFSCN